jgi:nucleotidyltransferase/DNA polymerase involved in DNA repair
MYRIACLRIPQFQIAVQQKHNPALSGKPFVLLAETQSINARSRVVMCSEAALKKHIVPGMQLSQAQALAANLVFFAYDHKLYRQKEKELAQILINCSPKVKALEPGIFLLDACGLKNMGGEDNFALAILKQTSKAGFTQGCIGLADTAFAALVASKYKCKRWYVVPKDGDRQFLAPLSIHHLPLSDDAEEALLTLGIKTIGQLAAFCPSTLTARFGQEILQAYDLACGHDRRKPELPVKESAFVSEVELSAPLDTLNQTLFVLKSMLDYLLKELSKEDLLAEEFTLVLANESKVIDERPIKLIRPSKHQKFLLEVIKLALEAKPVGQEFTQIKLVVSRFCRNDWEQSKLPEAKTRSDTILTIADTGQQLTIEPTGKQREDLANLSPNLLLLFQRFATRLGEKALVYPVPNDNYLPDNNGIWASVLEDPEPTINRSYLENILGAAGLATGLVCKYLATPIPLLVEFDNSTPIAIFYQQKWQRIKQLTAPECISSSWWDRPVKKSYYQALLEDRLQTNAPNTLVLLVHDHRKDTWFIEGFFD